MKPARGGGVTGTAGWRWEAATRRPCVRPSGRTVDIRLQLLNFVVVTQPGALRGGPAQPHALDLIVAAKLQEAFGRFVATRVTDVELDGVDELLKAARLLDVELDNALMSVDDFVRGEVGGKAGLGVCEAACLFANFDVELFANFDVVG